MIQEGRGPQPQCDAYTIQAKAAENMNPAEVYQLHDAETSITFSRDDHPPAVPRPGHAPLVLDAQIGGYDMDRVFMDGGSSMNIIFASTLQKMLIPQSVWKKSGTVLNGVVPGETAPYWDGQHSRSSWQFHTTLTSTLRCQDQQESS